MSLELLVFEIAGSRFGLSTSQVRSVLRAAALFPLPEYPDTVAGGLNLRGEIVPVIDGRVMFAGAHQPMHPRDHLIVFEADGNVAAIHVDRALELAVTDPPASDERSAHGRFVQCVRNTALGATSVLDAESLLRIVRAAEIPVSSGPGSEA